jgi:hypothetical protein
MAYCDLCISHKPTRIGLRLAQASLYYAFRKLTKYGKIGSVIEAGPGRGLFAKACREHGIDYMGIDCNTKTCESMRKQGFEMKQAYAPPFPGDIAPADAFVAIMVIEHMPTCDKAQEFVQGARELIKDDGLILLGAPDIRYIREYFWHVGYSHNYVTSTYRLAQLLHENDFEVLYAGVRNQCFGFPWSHVLWYLSRLVPCNLLEALFGNTRRLGRSLKERSVWFEAKIVFAPSALVIGRKKKDTGHMARVR